MSLVNLSLKIAPRDGEIFLSLHEALPNALYLAVDTGMWDVKWSPVRGLGVAGPKLSPGKRLAALLLSMRGQWAQAVSKGVSFENLMESALEHFWSRLELQKETGVDIEQGKAGCL